ncbi:MAG: hypothetical protein ABUK01_03810 [Leptospirales bacterium]
MRKIRYIIQARMESKRLPGKVLRLIGEKPLLEHMVDRLFLSGAKTDEIVFALGEEDDDSLRSFLQRKGLSFFSGDKFNVLSRYLLAANDLDENDTVVRITGDNPFLDYHILSAMLNDEKSIAADLAYPVKLPTGMGFEVIRVGALKSQTENELSLYHKEHVTIFMRENPNLYNILPTVQYEDVPDIRLTVDYVEDLEQAEKTWQYFSGLGNANFCTSDVYQLAREQADFFNINKNSLQRSALSYEKPPS